MHFLIKKKKKKKKTQYSELGSGTVRSIKS